VKKGIVGRRHCIRHSRAKAAVDLDKTIQWMSGIVHLTADRIVGPFDFEIIRQPVKRGAKHQASCETERVPEYIWTQLERRGPECDVEVTNIHARVEHPYAL
jgi:capsid protein